MTTPSFKFITNSELRTSLESDFQELLRCFGAESWKAVHVLAGSIVEALLVDTLIAESVVTDDRGLNLDLSQAISLCRKHGIISERTENLATVVRGYRNLIHPGRIVRLGEKVDSESATVAKALVTIVQSEIEARRTDKYGYTAEQIIQKVESDSSVDAIMSHLVNRTNKEERSRLLLEKIPEAYLRLYERWRTGSEFDPEMRPSALDSLPLLYREVFQQVPAAVKQKAVAHYTKVLQEDPEAIVRAFGGAFFVARDLTYAEPDDLAVIKSHLLGRMARNVDDDVLNMLPGIGPFLEVEETSKFLDPLVKELTSRSQTYQREISALIVAEYNNIP